MSSELNHNISARTNSPAMPVRIEKVLPFQAVFAIEFKIRNPKLEIRNSPAEAGKSTKSKCSNVTNRETA
jgi:hypothetical protein